MIRVFLKGQRVPDYIERITPSDLHATFEHWLTLALRFRGHWLVMPVIERKGATATILLNGKGQKVIMTGGPTIVTTRRGILNALALARDDSVSGASYDVDTIERLAVRAPTNPEAADELKQMGVEARLVEGGVAWNAI